jgi:hypothetical protein
MMFETVGRGTRLALAGGFIVAIASIASPASADSVRFWLGDSGYGGVFNGAGTVYNDLKANATNCANTDAACTDPGHTALYPDDSGAADFTGTSLTFTSSGRTITATTDTTFANNKVWDDMQPHYAGLGVGSGTDCTSNCGAGNDGNDQINGSNILKLNFDTKVTLTGVATLFDSGHTPFGNNVPTNNTSTAKFKISLNDGVSWIEVLFTDANLKNLGAYDLDSTDFWFMEDGDSNPQFYVSALEWSTDTINLLGNTPLPAALPLFASGLGALGLLGLRRKRKTQATA